AFVRKAIEIATQNPKILPPAFDLEEMRRDAQLFVDLAPIRIVIDQLQKQVRDTVMQAGSEAYAAARAVYAYAKNSLTGASLEVAAGDLAQRSPEKPTAQRRSPPLPHQPLPSRRSLN